MKRRFLSIFLSAAMVMTSISPTYAAEFSDSAAAFSDGAFASPSESVSVEDEQDQTASEPEQNVNADESGGIFIQDSSEADDTQTEDADSDVFIQDNTETESDQQTDDVSVSEDNSLFDDQMAVDAEDEELFAEGSADGSIPETAVELTPGMSYDAWIASDSNAFWFKYTPSDDGKFSISSSSSSDTYVDLYSEDDLENGIAYSDDDGEGTNFRLNYNLTAGITYYYRVRFYSYGNEGTIPVTFEKYEGVSEITILQGPTRSGWYGLDQMYGWWSLAYGLSFQVTYTDGSVETVTCRSNSVQDSSGRYFQISLYDVKYNDDGYLEPGAYDVEVRCSEADIASTNRSSVEVKDLSGIPEIQILESGNNPIEMPVESNNNLYMKFTPSKEGTYRIRVGNEEDTKSASIYDEHMNYVSSDELVPGSVYYVLVSNLENYKAENGNVSVYTQYIPQIKKISLSGTPRTDLFPCVDVFSSGNFRIPGLIINVEYANGETEQISEDTFCGEAGDSGEGSEYWYTKKGYRIGKEMRDSSGECISSIYEPGNYTACYYYGDIEAFVHITLKSPVDLPVLTTESALTVDKSAYGFGWCKFVVPSDGNHKYIFHHSDMGGYYNPVRVQQYTENGMVSIGVFNGNAVFLNAGETYYLSNASSYYWVEDEYGETEAPYDSPTLTFEAEEVTMVTGIEVIEAPDNTDVYLGADISSVSRIYLPGLKFRVTYSDGTTEELYSNQKNKTESSFISSIEGIGRVNELTSGEYQVTYSIDEASVSGITINVKTIDQLPELTDHNSVTVTGNINGHAWLKFVTGESKRYSFTIPGYSHYVNVYSVSENPNYESFEEEYYYSDFNMEGDRGSCTLKPNTTYYMRMYCGTSESMTVSAESLPYLSGLEMITPPDDTTIVRAFGANFNGLSVKAIFSDGTDEIVMINGISGSTSKGDHIYCNLYDPLEDRYRETFYAPVGNYKLRIYCDDVGLITDVDISVVSMSSVAKEWKGEENLISLSDSKMYELYKFVPEETASYLFYSTHYNGVWSDPLLTVYDSNEDWYEEDDDGADKNNFRLQTTLTAGKTYYLRFRCYGESIPYVAHLTKCVAVSKLEVVSQPKQNYYLKEFDQYSLEGLQFKITYADDSTEIGAYNGSNRYFEKIRKSIVSDNDNELKLKFTCGGQAVEYSIPKISIEDSRVGVTSITTDEWTRHQDKGVSWYKFVSKQSGIYKVAFGDWSERGNLTLYKKSDVDDSYEPYECEDSFNITLGEIYYLCAQGPVDFKMTLEASISQVEIIRTPDREQFVTEIFDYQNEMGDIFRSCSGLVVRVVYSDGSTGIEEIDDEGYRDCGVVYWGDRKDGKIPLIIKDWDNLKVYSGYEADAVSMNSLPKEDLVVGESVEVDNPSFGTYKVYQLTVPETGEYFFNRDGAVYVFDHEKVIYDGSEYSIKLEKGKTYQVIADYEYGILEVLKTGQSSKKITKIQIIDSMTGKENNKIEAIYGLDPGFFSDFDFDDRRVLCTFSDGSTSSWAISDLVEVGVINVAGGSISINIDYDYRLQKGVTEYKITGGDVTASFTLDVKEPSELAVPIAREKERTIDSGTRELYIFTSESSKEILEVLGGSGSIRLYDADSLERVPYENRYTDANTERMTFSTVPGEKYYVLAECYRDSSEELALKWLSESTDFRDVPVKITVRMDTDEKMVYGLDTGRDLYSFIRLEYSDGTYYQSDAWMAPESLMRGTVITDDRGNRIYAKGRELVVDESGALTPGAYQIIFYVEDHPEISSESKVVVKDLSEVPKLVSGGTLEDGYYAYTPASSSLYTFILDNAEFYSMIWKTGNTWNKDYRYGSVWDVRLEKGVTYYFDIRVFEDYYYAGRKAVCTVMEKDYVDWLELVRAPQTTVYYSDSWAAVDFYTAALIKGAWIRVHYISGKEELICLDSYDEKTIRTSTGEKIYADNPYLRRGMDGELVVTVTCGDEELDIPVTVKACDVILPSLKLNTTVNPDIQTGQIAYYTFTPSETCSYFIDGNEDDSYYLEGYQRLGNYSLGVLTAGRTYHIGIRARKTSDHNFTIKKAKDVSDIQIVSASKCPILGGNTANCTRGIVIKVTYADGSAEQLAFSGHSYQVKDSYGNAFTLRISSNDSSYVYYAVTLDYDTGDTDYVPGIRSSWLAVPRVYEEDLEKSSETISQNESKKITVQSNSWKQINFTAAESGYYTITFDKAPQQDVVVYSTFCDSRRSYRVYLEPGRTVPMYLSAGDTAVSYTISLKSQEERTITLVQGLSQKVFPYGTTLEDIDKAVENAKIRVTYADNTSEEVTTTKPDKYGNYLVYAYSTYENIIYYYLGFEAPYSDSYLVAVEEFTIEELDTTKSIASATVTGLSDQTYAGNAIRPSVTVKLQDTTLVKDRDYTVSYLNNNRAGTATVRITGMGAYSGSITRTFKIRLSNVTLDKAVPVSGSSIKVSWQAVPGAKSYQIYRRTGSTGWTLLTSEAGSPFVTEYVDTSAVKGTKYTYTVRAKDESELSPGWDNTGVSSQVLENLSNVTLLDASVVRDGIEITWNVLDYSDTYQIYRKTAGTGWKLLTGQAVGGSYVDTSVTKGVTYTYTVRGMNGSILSPGWDDTGVSATVPTKLANVTLVGAVAEGSGIKVTWKAVEGAGAYQIYRKTAETGWKLITDHAAGTYYIDEDVLLGTVYTYTVRGKSQDVLSPGWDNTGVSATFPVKLSNVTLVGAREISNGIEISWKQVSNAQTYQIYRKTATTGWQMITNKATGSSYVDTTAAKGVVYTYTVRGMAGSSLSPSWDNTGVSAQRASNLSNVKLVDAIPVLRGIRIAWKPVAGALSYQIYRKTAGTSWSLLTDSATGTEYTDTSAMKGITYTYTVRAKAGSTLSPGWDNTGVSAIGNVRLTNIRLVGAQATDSGIKVMWRTVENAEQYQIYRKTAGTSWKLITETATGSSYVDTTAVKDVTYSYTVRGKNGAVLSPSWDNTGVTATSVTKLANVTLVGASAVSNGIRIRWKELTDARTYQIYRKTASTGWSLLTDQATGCSYVDNTAIAGVAYTYTVRGKFGSILSPGWDNKGVSATFTASSGKSLENVRLISAKVSGTGILVTWNYVEGADQYQIYRKTATTGWSLIKGDAIGNSYSDTAVSKDVVYTYTVRAKSGSNLSPSWDNKGVSTVVVSKLDNVVLGSAEAKSSGIQIKWNEVTNAEFYQIYRSTGGSGWSLITSKATGDNYLDTNVSKGTTYKYTVRAINGSVLSPGWDNAGVSAVAK